MWATQRIEEIRGFADRVSVLVDGRVRFSGPVARLLAEARPAEFVVRVAGGPQLERMQAEVGADGAAVRAP